MYTAKAKQHLPSLASILLPLNLLTAATNCWSQLLKTPTIPNLSGTGRAKLGRWCWLFAWPLYYLLLGTSENGGSRGVIKKLVSDFKLFVVFFILGELLSGLLVCRFNKASFEEVQNKKEQFSNVIKRCKGLLNSSLVTLDKKKLQFKSSSCPKKKKYCYKSDRDCQSEVLI